MKHIAITLTIGIIGLGMLSPGIFYGADIPALQNTRDSAERARVQALIDDARKETNWTGEEVYLSGACGKDYRRIQGILRPSPIEM